uniref:Reverse transcriptase zinc-binding domain-containing protein n=1 Tax=Aegilops tauschii subsp. strangulata TaxID=200361 RepID=A0A453KVK7_AEGTS
WLSLQDRCWTAERLARHGLPHELACALCDQEDETMQHLLAGCSFSRQVWHDILAWARSPTDLPTGDTDLLAWWASSCALVRAATRKGLSSLIILIAWWIWKHRNSCTFDGDRPPVSHLCSTIKDEARLWAQAGAAAITNIIPER